MKLKEVKHEDKTYNIGDDILFDNIHDYDLNNRFEGKIVEIDVGLIETTVTVESGRNKHLTKIKLSDIILKVTKPKKYI